MSPFVRHEQCQLSQLVSLYQGQKAVALQLVGPKIMFFRVFFLATWCNATLQAKSNCVAVRRHWCGHPIVLVLDCWNVLLFDSVIFEFVTFLPQHQNDSVVLNFVGHVNWLLLHVTQNIHRICNRSSTCFFVKFEHSRGLSIDMIQNVCASVEILKISGTTVFG